MVGVVLVGTGASLKVATFDEQAKLNIHTTSDFEAW